MGNKHADGSLAKAEAGRNIPTVWVLVPSFHPVIGGEEVQVREVYKACIAKGWPIKILTRRHVRAHYGRLAARDTVEGIPVFRVFSRGGNFASVAYILSTLWQLMRHGRRAIYHAHDIGAVGWAAVVAGRLLRGRSVIKLRSGRYGYTLRLSSRLTRWQFTRLVHLADRVVAVSTEVEGMVRELGVPEQRVVLIPNGVDTSYFYPIPIAEKIATRWRLDLPADKTIVLFVGRLDPIKGLDVLLQGWALLPEDVRCRALLLLVGEGPERGRLEAMTQSLGLQGTVMLLGEQQAVTEYYHTADIFVLPSRSEGLSVSLLEAMASGLPVIVSHVGGALDIVKEPEHGFLFESEAHHELAEKLLAILDKKDRWPEMGARARQSVLDYADLDTTADRLLDLYRQLA